MTDGDNIDVSTIIVTYNSRHHIDGAIESVLRATADSGLSGEIIVVDNASKDGTVRHVRAAHPGVLLMQNDLNVGFGRANNAAFQAARGSAWMLLNPDARLAPTALSTLLAALRDCQAGAVGPSIGDRGAESAGMAPGIRSAIGHFLFVNRLLPGARGGPWRGIQVRRVRRAAPVPVDWASAAALLLDPQAVRALDGFDPRFFLYGEDVDLGIRLKAAGRTVWLVPAARAEHAIAASQSGVSTRWLVALHDLYADSHGRLSTSVFDFIAAVGLTIRAVAAAAASDSMHRARMQASARDAWRMFLRLSVARTDVGRGSGRS